MVNVTEWDPDYVLLTDDSVDDAWKACVLQGVYFSKNEYSGSLGARISSVFVIGIVSTFFTVFPLLARTYKKLKMPLYVYLFARYAGTGVIVATAFIHLLDPAYAEIGGLSCVGQTGNWAVYSWCPAIILASVMCIFLIDVASDTYVTRKYGICEQDVDADEILKAVCRETNEQDITESPQLLADGEAQMNTYNVSKKSDVQIDDESLSDSSTIKVETSFRAQIAAFLVLEFGIIFHSVMIGLNLGACGDEFKTLYIVLVFHQSFEGLGIGARLSAIPWPKHIPYYWAYLCCIAYGLVTPISIAIGLGIRTTYVPGSYNANLVTGILDAVSAGILIYSGLVELLAKDFLFNKACKKDLKQLLFMINAVLWGAGIMALLGKWA